MDTHNNDTESLGVPFLNPFLSLRRQTQVFGGLLCLCTAVFALSLAWSYGYHRHESDVRRQIAALSVAKGHEVSGVVSKLENTKAWGSAESWEALMGKLNKAVDYKKEHPKADVFSYIYPAQEQYLNTASPFKAHIAALISGILVLFLMWAYLNRRKDEIKQDWVREKESNLETQRNLMNLSVALQPYIKRQFTAPIGTEYKNILGLVLTNINSIILMIMGFLSGLNRKNGDLQVNAQMLKTLLKQVGSQESGGFPQVQDVLQKLEMLAQSSERNPQAVQWDIPPVEQAAQLHKLWEKSQESEQMGFTYIADITSQFKQLESLLEQYGLLAITLDWGIQSLNLDEDSQAKAQMLKESLSRIHQLSDKTRQEVHNINEKLGFYRQKRDITLQNSGETQALWNVFMENMGIQKEQNRQWEQFVREYDEFNSQNRQSLAFLLSRMQQVSERSQEWNNKVIAQQNGLSQVDNLLNDFLLRLQDLNEAIKSIRISEAETPTVIGVDK